MSGDHPASRLPCGVPSPLGRQAHTAPGCGFCPLDCSLWVLLAWVHELRASSRPSWVLGVLLQGSLGFLVWELKVCSLLPPTPCEEVRWVSWQA